MDSRLALAEVRRLGDRAVRIMRGDSPGYLIKVWQIGDLGLGFVHNAKVATRSMRSALASHATKKGGLAAQGSDVSRAVRLFERRLTPRQIRSLRRRHWTFGFVRNPLDRLYSSYADKVVRLRRDLFERSPLEATMDFPAFVRQAVATRDDDCDVHIRSQHSSLMLDGEVVVSFLGRFERLEDDWRVIADRFGLPALPRHNVSAEGDYREAYDPELARLAMDRYRTDVEVFGYQSEVETLIDGKLT